MTNPQRDDMSSIKTTARKAGLLYLLMGVPAALSLQYMPLAFIVPGDAAATASRISGAALTYRLLVLCELVSPIAFLFLAWMLYRLFKDVDKKLAMLLVILVSISCAIGVVNIVNTMAPLVLLSGADFLSVFTRPQLEALALGFLRLHSQGLVVDGAFWGLWLFPFGVLVIKSGFIPRLLGVFLIVGCFAYLATCFTSIVFPAHTNVVSQIALPFFALAELPIWAWLLAKGAKEVPEAQAATVS
jgi:hypothetical protein